MKQDKIQDIVTKAFTRAEAELKKLQNDNVKTSTEFERDLVKQLSIAFITKELMKEA